MSRLITFIRKSIDYLTLSLLWLVSAAPAWAQDQSPIEEEAQADWVLSYALVILCIGLAVFVVCRPGRRGSDVRRPP